MIYDKDYDILKYEHVEWWLLLIYFFMNDAIVITYNVKVIYNLQYSAYGFVWVARHLDK